jgi:hypothetical protein
MEALRPNAQRAKIAMALIWIVVGLDIITALSDYFQYVLLEAANNGFGITEEEATANDSRQMIIGAIYFIVYVCSAVTFIMWFRRAFYNLHQRTQMLPMTEGWAAGAWFVPILNLFKPVQIMQAMSRETSNIIRERSPQEELKNSSVLIGFWWGFWILNNLLGNILLRMNGETIDELMSQTVLSMVNALIGIPLGLITVKMIYDHSKLETRLEETEPPVVPVITDSSEPQQSIPV